MSCSILEEHLFLLSHKAILRSSCFGRLYMVRVLCRRWSHLAGFTLSRTSCHSCHLKTSPPTLRWWRTTQAGTVRRLSSSHAGELAQTVSSFFSCWGCHHSRCHQV